MHLHGACPAHEQVSPHEHGRMLHPPHFHKSNSIAISRIRINLKLERPIRIRAICVSTVPTNQVWYTATAAVRLCTGTQSTCTGRGSTAACYVHVYSRLATRTTSIRKVYMEVVPVSRLGEPRFYVVLRRFIPDALDSWTNHPTEIIHTGVARTLLDVFTIPSLPMWWVDLKGQ